MILLILLLMSVACWTVFFYKLILLRVKNRQMKKGLAQVQGAKKLHDLEQVESALSKTLPGYILDENVSFARALIGSSPHISPNQWEQVQYHVEHTVDSVMHHEESYLAVLSTSADVAPLLGLFGTVWGLVHAFIAISEQQSADIAAVAPGIAEALMTTLVGLVVAIPALAMFNYLNTQIRTLEHDVVKFSNALSVIMRTMIS